MANLLQMTTGPESGIPSSSDLSNVDGRSDAELDALPFGVIGLDEIGTILRYNLYESRLARLDRNQVLGRDFFTEVALCTRTEAFEGRFRTFVSGPPNAPPVRFDFLFDFKFGAQEVSVELLRTPGTQRFYLLIGRAKISPPRADFPVERLAALQKDLAPDEATRGVLRDDLERRFIGAPAVLFAALRATCDRLAPETWQLFATEWGVQWGRRAAVDLEATALEAGLVSVRDMSMRDAASRVSAYFAERGWGSVAFDFTPAIEGIIVADLDRSALAEARSRQTRRSHLPRTALIVALEFASRSRARAQNKRRGDSVPWEGSQETRRNRSARLVVRHSLNWLIAVLVAACGTSSASPSHCGEPATVQYSRAQVDGGSLPTCAAATEFGVPLEEGFPIATQAILPLCGGTFGRGPQSCLCEMSGADAGASWVCPQ